MRAYGIPGVDLHTPTGKYVYPKGPKHYGLGVIRCEETGKMTPYGVQSSHQRSVGERMRYICEWCATDTEVVSSRSLAELNEERKTRG